MALRKKYELQVKYSNNLSDEYIKYLGIEKELTNNITFENVYIKIEEIEGNKDMIDFSVSSYKDNITYFKIQSKNYSFIPSINDNALNFIKQAYEYLKTLDEYKDAVDC